MDQAADWTDHEAETVRKAVIAEAYPSGARRSEKTGARLKITPTYPQTPKASKDAPAVQLRRGERVRILGEVLNVLLKRGDLYERGGELVRILDAGTVEPVHEEWLLHLLDAAISFTGRTKDDRDEPRDAPQWLGRRISARCGDRQFKELRSVITAPTLRDDGTLLDRSGYDAKSGLLLMPGARPFVPGRPSMKQMKEAAATLWKPVALFPYTDDTARGVMLAAVLTAVIRNTLPLAPAFSFDAPMAGTGKTYLAFCLQALCGMDREAIPECKDEEEVRKRLLSTLRSGKPAMLFDNIRGQFGSSAIEGMLTAQVYSDRLLGGSKMLALPTTALVLFSGNNFRPTGDLWRRLLTCRIDAKMESPERRTFDFDPVTYCQDNRQQLVAAGLTLLRGFVAAGSPRATPDRIASFEDWDDRVRQAVIWFGMQDIMPVPVGDPVEAMERAKKSEPERQKLGTLLAAVHASHRDGKWRVADLIEEAKQVVSCPTTAPEHVKVLREVLIEIAGERGEINPRILGRWIERQAERPCDGAQVVRVGTRWKTALWQVQGQPKGDADDQ